MKNVILRRQSIVLENAEKYANGSWKYNVIMRRRSLSKTRNNNINDESDEESNF